MPIGGREGMRGWEAMEGKTKASHSCGVQSEEREEEDRRENKGRGGGGEEGQRLPLLCAALKEGCGG
ncbi:unnamed protein product [Prunus armeniaca]|uniref:Uncharacterized protein n=1 Tax=Prunus armeniaca TaxID=36596 RepID=A0A6J5VN30_PRUAR|nr:unnamed protein product [Prunus armeniaca]